MKRAIASTAVAMAVVFAAGAAQAAKPVVYPAKGQSATQQTRDDSQCNSWAKTNTGIDPAAAASAPPPASGPAVGRGYSVK